MTATVRGVSVEGREGSFDKEAKSEYSVVYFVTCDDIQDGPSEVRQAFGIPAIGDMYSVGNDFDAQAICVSKTAVQRESPWEWEVNVNYSTKSGDKPEEESNPLLQPAEVSFSSQSRTKVIPGYYQDPQAPESQRDLQLGVVSSNGEMFDPAPEMEVADPVLVIKKNLQSVNIGEVLSWGNAVNVSAFYGAEARTLRLSPPQMTRQYDSVVGYYWEVSFEFVYRFDTWDLQLLNVGTYYIDQVQDKRWHFKDEEGHPFMGLLNADGGALNWSSTSPADWGRYKSSGEAPTFTRKRIYREIDFNTLGIL